jgi:hypothetical protein
VVEMPDSLFKTWRSVITNDGIVEFSQTDYRSATSKKERRATRTYYRAWKVPRSAMFSWQTRHEAPAGPETEETNAYERP